MARHNASNPRAPRLYVTGDLAPAARLDAAPGQHHYLRNVMRAGDGDPVLLFNGRDGEWRAALEPAGRKATRLACVEQTRQQSPAPALDYLFAPLKQARIDYMAQKATEMGAGVLRPVITERTAVARVNAERLQANAIEAAEQCGLMSVPRIAEPRPLGQALDAWPPGRTLVFCDEAAAAAPPLDALRARPGAGAPGVLIGPEGGFSQAERADLLARPFVLAISLGPRVMRADTAAVAALAVVQATIGDWQTGR